MAQQLLWTFVSVFMFTLWIMKGINARKLETSLDFIIMVSNFTSGCGAFLLTIYLIWV